MLSRRTLGWVLVALASLGLAAAVSLPLGGEGALRRLRGRDIQAESGRRILGNLLAVAGAGGAGAALLVLSAGLLLCRRPEGAARPLPREVSAAGPRVAPAAWLVVAVLLVGSAVAAGILARRSFNYDEILAMSLDVKAPLARSFRPHGVFANHYTGALLARAGVAVGGDSELTARAGSVVVALAGIALTCAAGAWWGGRWAALVWPALFLGGHAFVLASAASIRGYAPLMTGCVVVAVAAALACDPRWPAAPRRARVGVVALAAVAALALGLSHLFGLLYLGALTLLLHAYAWTGWRALGPADGGDRAALRALAAVLSLAVAISFLAWTPALPWLFYNAGGTTTPALLHRVPAELSALFAGGENLFAGAAAAAFLFAATLWAAWAVPPLRLAAVAATVPLLALVAAAFLYRPTFLFARFFAPVLPLAALCAAAALGRWQARRPGPWLPAAVFAATAAVVAPGTVALFRESNGIREGVARSAALLREHGDERSRLVFLGDEESDGVVSYYAPPELRLWVTSREEWDARRAAGVTDLLVLIGTEPDALPHLPPDWQDHARPLPPIPTGARQSELRLWLIGDPRPDLGP